MPLCVHVHLSIFVCMSDLSKCVSVVEEGNTNTECMGTGVLVIVCQSVRIMKSLHTSG